ncbi:hypothetical protein SAMN05216262_10854 [Colwellia chukchiensis]|uniref:Uncharacterized protein n=1 Tax=Colwellia chukchiensis TaxID=641665 RepID=A0A1H7NQ36_9GAMM|nr:hypothetical protein [Colwellia chukchiensis]SEL25653.1 hypothetical protein SAMN05216262_10854 [Colwellia chukchiensis]
MELHHFCLNVFKSHGKKIANIKEFDSDIMLAEHGRWEIKIDNQVAVIWFADAWNEEAIVTFCQEFKRVTLPLLGKQWAIMSIFEQWQLGTPDIEHHVTELCEWFIANGCVKDSHVYTKSFLKQSQLERIIPKTDLNAGYERCVFTEPKQAINWLALNGFAISNPQFIYEKFQQLQ